MNYQACCIYARNNVLKYQIKNPISQIDHVEIVINIINSPGYVVGVI